MLTICCSSTSSVKKFYRLYVCGHCNIKQIRKRARRDNAKSEVSGETDESNNAVDASVGSQKDGGNLKRRININSAVLSGKPCPFNFRVRVDSVGFYVTLWGNCGVSYHQVHPQVPLDSLPKQKKSSLTQAKVDDAIHVTNATVDNDVFCSLFNELTELVDQCPEKAADVEQWFKDTIANLRKTVAAKGKPTSPSN